VHLGPLGSGQVTKLLNNVLFTANLGAAASALALGRALDVDTAKLAEVISGGSAQSFALARVADAGGTVDRIAAHAGTTLAKDVRLMADIAGAAGADTEPVLAAADSALALMHQQRVSQ
jgi:3-hydroxyisobutyrate dehydrogenase-like beta-hydroxyacid dehydrogenase